MAKITVQNAEITIVNIQDKDYISLTDMADAKEGESRAADIIKNWLRNRYTIEFLGTWEIIHNPNFKVVEFDHFKMQAGLPNFVLSVSEWIEATNAIGLVVKKGRYGGTYAYKDIAFEFGSAISVTFKLYLIKELHKTIPTEELYFEEGSDDYGLENLEEAKEYLQDQTLGTRLREITKVFYGLSGGPRDILGHPDHMKLKSCMTLFDAVCPGDIFNDVLEKFYQGKRCRRTFNKPGL